MPVSRAGEIIIRDDRKWWDRTGIWKKSDLLSGRVFYVCSECRAACEEPETFCPHCHAEMKKITYDPVWVDEIEFYE